MLDAFVARARKLFGGDLLKSALVAFFMRGMAAISFMVLSLVVARVLPLSESGLFFLAMTIVTFLGAVGLLGLNQSLLRFIGAHHVEQDWATINAAVLRATQWAGLSLVLLSLLLYLTAPWLSSLVFRKPELAEVLIGFSPGVFFLGIATLIAHQLQAIRHTSSSIFLQSIVIPFALAVLLLLVGAETAQTAGVLYSIVAALAVGLGIRFWRRARVDSQSGRIDAGRLWASCMPLWIVMLMSQSTQWSGQLVAGAWLPSEDLAHLAVAQRTAALVSFFLVAINVVVAPRFSALHAQQRHAELERLAIGSARLMTLFALPVLAAILFLPEWILGWFGDAYRAGAPLLVILGIGQFVNVMTGSVGFLLSMSGHERDLRNLVLLSGPLAIVLALILTPWFGAEGAAFATALAVASQNLLAVYRVKQRLGFNTLAIWKPIRKP